MEKGVMEEGTAKEDVTEEGMTEEGAAKEDVTEEGMTEEGTAKEDVTEEGMAEKDMLEKGVAEEGTTEKGGMFEFRDCFESTLGFQEADVGAYSPLVLAYVGDMVFDLLIKSMVVNEGNRQVQKIHERTSHYVQASAQSLMMRFIQPLLSGEEHAVFRRGRNAKSVSPAKNQSITDYRRATGFEALMGYLYLKKEYGRLVELVKIGLDGLDGRGDGR